MSLLDLIKYSVLGLFVLLCLYIVARVVSAAFFRSKHDYERTITHGTQKQPRSR